MHRTATSTTALHLYTHMRGDVSTLEDPDVTVLIVGDRSNRHDLYLYIHHQWATPEDLDMITTAATRFARELTAAREARWPTDPTAHPPLVDTDLCPVTDDHGTPIGYLEDENARGTLDSAAGPSFPRPAL